MRTLAKILVTKSIRLMMKRMRNLPRNPPDRSARFELNHPVFMTIADLCPPLQRAPASKSSKPASRAKRNKPSSSKKQAAEPIEEGDEE